MYEYTARVIKIIDGDTLDVEIDLGFFISIKKRVRLSKINAPEINENSGEVAKKFLEDSVELNKNIFIKTFLDKTDKYGRTLAEIYLDGSNLSINQIMVNNGIAKEYK